MFFLPIVKTDKLWVLIRCCIQYAHFSITVQGLVAFFFALLKIGKLVAENALPSIVAGDFNDVSWSHTSRMFGQQGNLKNVRIGRGLYNTFDATSFLFRWPLDHYFVTEEFKLVELARLPEFGSDHYPIYARFVLEP